MTDSIIQHLLENKKHTANHRNSKKTTTFVFNKCSVTYLRKCPIIQHLVSDSGHSQKRLKESGTTHICKAMKYTDLHLSPHSVYLSKQRLYRLKWTVTDNQWCKYAASKYGISISFVRKGRAAKDEQLRKVLRSELSNERATRLEGSFGTQKQHYSLSRIKARNRKTEILWIFFGIHTANAVQMIDKIKNRLDKVAWHGFTDWIRRGHQTSSATSCLAG